MASSGELTVKDALLQALVAPSSGDGGAGASVGSDVHRLQAFLAAAPTCEASSLPGPTSAELIPYAGQPPLAGLPPLPVHGEWVPPLPRRHLRRRQVHRELPAAPAVQPGPAQPQLQAAQAPDTRQQQAAQPNAQVGAAAGQAAPQGRQRLQQALDGLRPRRLAAAAGASANGPRQSARSAVSAGQQQLVALQQLTSQQLHKLQQAAALARQRLAASARQLPIQQQAQQPDSTPHLQRQQADAASQPGAAVLQAAAERSAVAVAALQRQFAALQLQMQQLVLALSRFSAKQLAMLRRAGQRVQAQGEAVSSSRPAAAQRQVQQRQVSQQLVATSPAAAQQQLQRTAMQSVGPPSAAVPAAQAQAAAVSNVLVQWGWAIAVAAAGVALAALRFQRARRRVARNAQQAIREAEQRARAGKVYDRTRQRFQRALVAAEDLEGADSSVFAAVGRKGASQSAATVAASASGGNPFLAGAGAAGSQAAEAEEEEEEDGSTDVFDPASWDEDTRKQWDSFVSSSKVSKGRLWDSSQVDEGLPEVWVDLSRE